MLDSVHAAIKLVVRHLRPVLVRAFRRGVSEMYQDSLRNGEFYVASSGSELEVKMGDGRQNWTLAG